MIPVTKPFLPPAEQYNTYLQEIWSREWLTNNGPLVQELESRLRQYLSLDHLLFTTNGTIALQIAIKALGLKGKIITTPFSYVATTSSVVWEGCEPVFADICRDTLTLNPDAVERAVTKDTSAILATHVYGNACDIDRLTEVANRHGLKVIYDAAHAFGTRYKGKSVFHYGDVSTASFHATKLFHTVEGGAVASRDAETIRRMTFMRNFGHHGPARFEGLGINGKNSEFHAAMGLCNLGYIDDILRARKDQSLYYNELLSGLPITRPAIQPGCEFNYAYYAVLFSDEKTLLRAEKHMVEDDIHPRRYFYPTLTQLPYVSGGAPICEEISRRVMCLPLYHSLTRGDQERVAFALRKI